MLDLLVNIEYSLTIYNNMKQIICHQGGTVGNEIVELSNIIFIMSLDIWRRIYATCG